jgi:hypothetical protein
MYCSQCGKPLDASSRKCSSCGTSSRPTRAVRIPAVAAVAVVVVALGGAAAFFFLQHRAPPPATPAGDSAAASQSQSPGTESTLPASNQAETDGFRWAALTPEELQAARSALDAAIAREEQIAGRAPPSQAAGVPLSPAPPRNNGSTDGVRL